jgi:hypothetical protein
LFRPTAIGLFEAGFDDMGLRNLARASLIHGSTLVGLDRLFLKSRQKHGRRGLVIGMHETPQNLRSQLKRQLEWAIQHFSLVSQEQFSCWWADDQAEMSKPPLLFTFDDGRESNFSVAAPLLEEFGTRGVFFVVPAFAECPRESALDFYRERINPSSKAGDELWEDWAPMSPAQIAELADRGHAIGNHTLSHTRLVGLPAEKLQSEIVESASRIRGWTRKPVDAFAWTFSWDAVDRKAWDVIREQHRFCFSPCPGATDPAIDSPHLIWRREIEADYSPSEFRFQYSGLGDLSWSSRRSRLRQLLGESAEGS